MAARKKRSRKVLLRRIALVLAGLMALSVVLVLVLRWVDPPTSAFMIQRWIAAHSEPGEPPYVYHEWVDWDAIPGAVKLAVIAAEDQRFPGHRGFDTIEIERAWQRYRAGERLRGASTISQQTAKNLFLWSGRDPIRKALEVWFTFLIETLWPKERILEVYLNIAQLSPNTFGVGAASWRYFDRPVMALSASDAALIAAVLPNPNIYRLETPSSTVKRRATWIQRQMAQLGGVSYLKKL
ncbi:monofunctional biosynthetic peptidoglycan transglycosylase [Thiocapsa rosea]|uniref:monofunctional biosynthetic peptidoglycan transglycosylase n=1 Tax=Thiocapsa rosea TaxID=69360 RepID=UPI000EB571B2|nr:monofunctional biosynthetic peptidoglycan transglycosylase [Thiocapsa rosea]